MLLFKKMPDVNFEIRPHPHESKYIWYEFCKKVPNVALSKNISLVSWLKDKSICINTFSTTAIDSAMQGIPSLSLDKLISKTTYERLPRYRVPFKPEFSYRPSCLNEAEKIIREKIENHNQEDKDRFEECFNKYKDVFNLERENKATHLIERFVSKSISIEPKKRKKIWLNFRILFIYLRSCFRFYKSNRKDCLFKPNEALFCNLNLD